MTKRIIIKQDACLGCLNCSAACMNAHRTGTASMFTLNMQDRNNPPRNRILQKDGKFYPLFCRNCDDPDCVKTCMSGALRKNQETGLVEYNPERCAACYMCVMMCRYGHPKPDPAGKTVIRCTFCQDTESKEPACVKACPANAIEVKEVE